MSADRGETRGEGGGPHRLTLDELRANGALEELAKVFAEKADANELLDLVAFPHSQRPSASKPIHFWSQVCREIENGLIDGGLERLLAEALGCYPGNRVFEQLASVGEPTTPRPAETVARIWQQRRSMRVWLRLGYLFTWQTVRITAGSSNS